MKTPEQAAAKWLANTTAATQTWLQGVESTNVDVMGRAIAAKSAAVAGFQRVMSDGSYEKAVQASGGTGNWKAKTQAKAANFGVGIEAGKEKQASAIAKILAAEAQIVASLPPRVPGNPQANLARVQGVVMGLHARKDTLKG